MAEPSTGPPQIVRHQLSHSDAILFASELKTLLHNHIESLRTKAAVSLSQGREQTSDDKLAKRS
jgi:hypothetical protein